MRASLLIGIACASLLGCAQQSTLSPQQIASARQAAHFERRFAETQANAYKDAYPERAAWRAKCETNPVTTVRTCRVAASARTLDAKGVPSGDSATPIYITYLDRDGPTLSIGDYLYPGSDATFRVDENPPVLVRGTTSAAQVIAQMRTGRVMRVQYIRWPTGAPQLYIDLKSAAAALDELDTIRIR